MKIVSYEVAKLAKEKGYNVVCDNYYTTNKELVNNFIHKVSDFDCYAPFQTELCDWLRVNGLHIYAKVDFNPTPSRRYYTMVVWVEDGEFALPEGSPLITKYYSTYEEAIEDGIKATLELL